MTGESAKRRRSFAAALARLMQLKAAREITVKELVEEVDINRSTFYLHYTDIYDMLKKTENELLESINLAIETHPLYEKPRENAVACLEESFRTLASNKEICAALLGPNGDIAFLQSIESLIVKSVIKDLAPLLPENVMDSYLPSFCFSGCLGLIRAWLSKNCTDTPAHMAHLTYKLVAGAMDVFRGGPLPGQQ